MTAEISTILKTEKNDQSMEERLSSVEWKDFVLGDLFDIDNTSSFNSDSLVPGSQYDYVTRTSTNQGVLQETGFINEENINKAGTWSLGLLQMDFFYRKKDWYAGQYVRKITAKIEIPEKAIPFMTVVLNNQKPVLLSVLVRSVDTKFITTKVQLPCKNGKIDFDFMETFILDLEKERVKDVLAYLKKFKDESDEETTEDAKGGE